MTYAETHEKLQQAKRDGVAEIRIEIDPGEFTVTVDEALEMFDNIAPGEWFQIVEETERQPRTLATATGVVIAEQRRIDLTADQSEELPARQPVVDEPCGGCGDPYCQA